MENNFCNYETAKMLKHLKFNEPCIASYAPKSDWHKDGALVIDRKFDNKNSETSWTTAPLWQQVEDWLWGERGIIVSITPIDIETIEMNIYKGCKYLEHRGTYSLNPITAKTEGLKAAVKHLFEQLNKTK